MKRNENVSENNRPWWQKVGGGHFYAIIDGRKKIIKPGEKFRAYEEEIPQAFRDVVISLSKTTTTTPVANKPITKKVYTKKEDEENEGDWYVYDAQGKKVNDEALTEEDADQLIVDLG